MSVTRQRRQQQLNSVSFINATAANGGWVRHSYFSNTLSFVVLRTAAAAAAAESLNCSSIWRGCFNVPYVRSPPAIGATELGDHQQSIVVRQRRSVVPESIVRSTNTSDVNHRLLRILDVGLVTVVVIDGSNRFLVGFFVVVACLLLFGFPIVD